MGKPTEERTELLKEIAALIKATKDPKVVARLAAQYQKITKQNTLVGRPRLEPEVSTAPSSKVLWLESDLYPVDGSWTGPEPIAALKAANEIIKAPGFWTLVGGERRGPEMRKQGRRFGSITASGQDTGIWEETDIVLEGVISKMGGN